MDFDPSSLIETVQNTVDQVNGLVDEDMLRTIGCVGADLFRDQAKQNALSNKKTGILFDNIIVKRLEEESDAGRKQVYLVTVRNGNASSNGAYYWRWVENGHIFVPPNRNISPKTGRRFGWKAHRIEARRIDELESGTKRAKAHPFMRPAYEGRKQDAVDLMTRTLAEQMARNSR